MPDGFIVPLLPGEQPLRSCVPVSAGCIHDRVNCTTRASVTVLISAYLLMCSSVVRVAAAD